MPVYKYIEWFDAAEMHEHSKECLTRLLFIQDEQQFLNSLTKSMGFKAMHQNQFERLKEFRTSLSKNRELLNSLISEIQKHLNKLKILLDGKDQLALEKSYRKNHSGLIKKINEYVLEYQKMKRKGFDFFTIMLKDGKKLLLSNPDYKLRNVSQKTAT